MRRTCASSALRRTVGTLAFLRSPIDAFEILLMTQNSPGDFLSAPADGLKMASAMERIDASSRKAEHTAASVGHAQARRTAELLSAGISMTTRSLART